MLAVVLALLITGAVVAALARERSGNALESVRLAATDGSAGYGYGDTLPFLLSNRGTAPVHVTSVRFEPESLPDQRVDVLIEDGLTEPMDIVIPDPCPPTYSELAAPLRAVVGVTTAQGQAGQVTVPVTPRFAEAYREGVQGTCRVPTAFQSVGVSTRDVVAGPHHLTVTVGVESEVSATFTVREIQPIDGFRADADLPFTIPDAHDPEVVVRLRIEVRSCVIAKAYLAQPEEERAALLLLVVDSEDGALYDADERLLAALNRLVGRECA